jgi:fluoride exporter
VAGFLVAVCIGAAGALGAAARFGVAEWIARHWQGHFPVATLLINVSGAFALGLLLAASRGNAHSAANARLVLGTGFLGGYTTFSALCFETFASARGGRQHTAWLYAAGTLALGALAAAAGIALGHTL